MDPASPAPGIDLRPGSPGFPPPRLAGRQSAGREPGSTSGRGEWGRSLSAASWAGHPREGDSPPRRGRQRREPGRGRKESGHVFRDPGARAQPARRRAPTARPVAYLNSPVHLAKSAGEPPNIPHIDPVAACPRSPAISPARPPWRPGLPACPRERPALAPCARLLS